MICEANQAEKCTHCQLKLIMKFFNSFKLGYCPLVWMDNSSTLHKELTASVSRHFKLSAKTKKQPYKNFWKKSSQ